MSKNTVDSTIKNALILIKNAIASGSENHAMGAVGFVQRLCDRTTDPQQTKRDIWSQLSQTEREKFWSLLPEDQKAKPTPPQPEPPKETKQVLLDGQIYITQLDIWTNKIFAVGDRVVSLIPGEVGRTGTIREINRIEAEKLKHYDDLIVIWEDAIRDCLYFNQVAKNQY